MDWACILAYITGEDNILLSSTTTKVLSRVDGPAGCNERQGGLLKYCHHEVA